MQYVVIEDTQRGSAKIEIHLTSCPNYLQLGKDITSVEWHGPYENYRDARQVAEKLAQDKRVEYRNASCCRPEPQG